jgi:hypothetical protein
MWNQSASPGADSLNKNSIDIDKAIHDRQLGIDTIKNITLPTSYWSKVALDTTQFVWKGDTAHYFTKYNLDTSAVPYKSDTLHYYTTYNLDTSAVPYKSDTLHYYTTYNFDTLKNFYRRDTIKYYSVYNLDTASKMTYAKDSSHLAHTDTLTTEHIKGVWTFWNIVRFIGIVTFDVSPVFNSLVNLANGVSVTGNASITGYTTLGDSTGSIPLKYCLVRGKIGANTNSNYNFALPQHLTGNRFKRVVSWTCNVRNDSAVSGQKKNISPVSWFGNLAYYASIDSMNCTIGLPATSNLINDSTTFCIWYRNE